ncbi:NitT/TauT family transport system substrate-binding protein [Micromonospora pattaloongensis]|uniref:NitT/TauT family transport system substrate-binding protein n=1 Tax=Micromonospora pattaloongensis TaxID=405436 RepID=A0A1H3JB95_9ACTN|nr:ABC transporter substrate-binding protein [Micromonospora pattaloongensis]SDY37182.1 NitT/TauT family transport system substrate-binding protein [Micromonospora pattaloongensis]
MRRLAIAATAAALLLGSIAACGGSDRDSGAGADGKKKVTLTLNWVPYGEHAPFYYGIKKGFYAEEGIELEVKPGNGSGKTLQAVAQNQTDFGWADTPPLLKAVATGMKVKSVGVFLQKGPSSIEFLADKNITKLTDLKGKTIGGTPGDAMYATFPALLKANGMAASDVKVVNVDAAGKIAALAEGKVDAIMGFFHDQAPTIEAKTGKKTSYLLFADWGMNMLGTGLVANDATLKKDSELVKAFVRATQKSWTEAAKDIPGATDAMAEMADNEPAKEVLVKQLTLALPLLKLDAGAAGVNDPQSWTESIELMTKYAELKDGGSPDKYWDNSFTSKG